MKTVVPHVLILGPSGSGKSSVARALAEAKRMLFLELDDWPSDPIGENGIRAQWEDFYDRAQPAALSAALRLRATAENRQAVAASMPSRVVLPPAHMEAARLVGISTVILYGSAADCLQAFLRRETSTGRNLPVEHWCQNNGDVYIFHSRPEYSGFRVEAFRNGRHRAIKSIATDVWRFAKSQTEL